jgi:hypothetical protein
MKTVRILAAAAFVPAAAFAATQWRTYARDPQHSARAGRAAQPLEEIHWHTPVDLDPQYSGGELFIHYGTPLVTSGDVVVLPVKTGADGGFRVEAHDGATGALRWQFDTDYTLPDHNWVPSCGACLAAGDRVVVPASGGTLLVRKSPARENVTPQRIAFYGIANYTAQQAAFDQHVMVCTPVTSDAKGDLYFGFLADAGSPMGLVSGFARISASGKGTSVTAAAAAGDVTVTRPAMNAAPALSRDGRTLYVAVRDDSNAGYVCALDAKTLARKSSVRLKDPLTTTEDSVVDDDSTASPSVGPDGDVYFGVLESASTDNHFRGWLLHFDGTLAHSKTPGSFGWDDTASVVPASAAPSYHGSSKYLLLTKYNDYAEAGGTGVNQVAVLDPNATQTDPRTGAAVMAEVLTIAGPTPDPANRDASHPDAVREWCINTAAVDARTKCALVNNEDGVLYRWDFRTNTLSENVRLTTGIGEAYTPTVVGKDGTVYAINNATLYAVGRTPAK